MMSDDESIDNDTRTGKRTVKPFELFFDLVFVFAFTQVTQFMAHDPDWDHLGKGVLLLLVMWWSWVGYSWLATTIDLDEGGVRLAIYDGMFFVHTIKRLISCTPDG